MGSEQYMAFGMIGVMVIAIIYFIPAINAYSKKHRHRGIILALNLLFGWTIVGWVICLGWSLGNDKDDPTGPTPETHVRCPDCRELILKDARKCKHCGTSLVPQ